VFRFASLACCVCSLADRVASFFCLPVALCVCVRVCASALLRRLRAAAVWVFDLWPGVPPTAQRAQRATSAPNAAGQEQQRRAAQRNKHAATKDSGRTHAHATHTHAHTQAHCDPAPVSRPRLSWPRLPLLLSLSLSPLLSTGVCGVAERRHAHRTGRGPHSHTQQAQ
jgi:hypothetical protein